MIKFDFVSHGASFRHEDPPGVQANTEQVAVWVEAPTIAAATKQMKGRKHVVLRYTVIVILLGLYMHNQWFC